MKSAHDCIANVDLQFTINRFDDTNISFLEIGGACKLCGRKIEFRGPMGVNPMHPTILGGDASLPFMLEGEEYDGKMPAITVTQKEPN